jgi:allophanate hydrolase subunit 2
MVPGAVQVPPSGLPVVFGPDHPATGGYPVIGVLTSTARDSLAQVPPGGSVRFVRATDATAEPAARPPVTA